MTLRREDAEQYWSQGFVRLPALFEREAVESYEARFEELASGRAAATAGLVIMRDVMVARGAVEPQSPLHAVNKILSFEADAALFAYALAPQLLAAVRELIGVDLFTISTNVFNKPPGVDGRHPLHQDLRYFSLRPADKIVATWTAISRCTRENGCLVVIPESHRGPLLRHGSPDWEYVNTGFYAAEGVDRERRVHIEMDPGDTLLFHPLLIHGSGQNRSSDFRRAISVHYASVECERPELRGRRDPVTRSIPSPSAS